MTQELRAMAQKAIELEVNNSKQVFYKTFVFSSLVNKNTKEALLAYFKTLHHSVGIILSHLLSTPNGKKTT